MAGLCTDQEDDVTMPRGFRKGIVPFLCILFVAALCVRFEADRFRAAIESPAGPLAWLTVWDPETTLPFVILLTLPLIILMFRNRRGDSTASAPSHSASRRQKICGCIVVFCVSLGASAAIGIREIPVPGGTGGETVCFAELPPAYHDEYSYLLQARTFAEGRLSWPPMTVRPDLFHQMHVLNEYRTASRYFPWTGIWTALFLGTGIPILGHWVAGALAAVFFYLSANLVLRPGTALTAGLLIAGSPGIAVFSNLLLAHHPTLLALSIFLWGMMQLQRRPSTVYALAAGISLSVAMLGRPLTAAGFALPWGILLAWQILAPSSEAWRTLRWKCAAGIALPLFAGFGCLGLLNHNITGSVFRTGYQEYTDTYTPRHAWGFNNGIRGDARSGPKVLTKYNQWAANLTAGIALKNVKNRCIASAQWSLGIIPVLLGLLLSLQRAVSGNSESCEQARARFLMLASVLSLHLVHVPYWFDGIMHWHYVFETAPLILILVADGLVSAVNVVAEVTSRRIATAWVASLLLAALVPGWVSVDITWGVSKVTAAVSELSYSRKRFQLFEEVVQSPRIRRPALILVDESSADPQLSYIINKPDLSSDVLVARRPETDAELTELQEAFPDRSMYAFDPQAFVISPIVTE